MAVPLPTPVRGVLMDVDGTLYRQGPLRVRMTFELARAACAAPGRARGLQRRLVAFRRVREELRERGRPAESLAELQYSETARRTGDTPEAVRATVDEWIFRRPLRHLAPLVRRGVRELLALARERGLALGVFSDYPADDKLRAMGLAGGFDVSLCATDAEVNAFKPHPAGFALGCERLGFAPAEVLYVGDRDDVDGGGARAAGMPVRLVSRRAGDERVRGFDELSEVLLAACP